MAVLPRVVGVDAKEVFHRDTHGCTDVFHRAVPRKTVEQRHRVAVAVTTLGNA
jgi:hypothetical protein